MILLGLICLVLVPNAYVAGLHDVPNAIAIPVRTRALTPRVATRVAAGFNALGVLLTLPLGIYLFTWFEFPEMDPVLLLTVTLCAASTLLGWNIFTYLRGMPTSITHALLAAFLGGTLAAAVVADLDFAEVLAMPWVGVVLTLLLSPLVAFGLAYLLVFAAVRFARGGDPDAVNSTSRMAQSVSVGVTSLGTGLQQGQRFSFVLITASTAAQIEAAEAWLPYAYVAFALLIGAGCLTGGWRIAHTLGHRLVDIDPLRGMVATTTTSGLLFVGSLGFALPLSTSLTAASSVIGAGSNQRFATVHWRQFRRICLYWVLTPLVAATVTALLTTVMSLLLG
ncbi:inorganic phosphate transporter [Nesterenkonia sp. AY15]|uniref:inorganic phosphate transporter n=1 Tax=unclassified Nesterenkonia TaxID=2629769 RepID=UPI001F4D2ADD|nr:MULTISPECIES: inorganic phosphate transporter [unclassified Nesterenkonia]MCH8563344.1 inorganic phosphate transporter [Nesterenkonia sp. YGD6]MCH8571122.1 inorganic phosphate transporter [Nesterenkonia sp. AY15]